MWVQSLGREDPLRRKWQPTPVFLGFPGGSDGKESDCNAEDPGLILGLERSPGGGHGNPSSILAWRIPMENRHVAWRATAYEVTKSWTGLSN